MASMKIVAVIPSMIKAVEDELDWVKRHRIGRSVLVYNGKLKGRSREKFIYTFETVEEKKLLEDAFVKVTVRKEEAEGVVLSVEGQFVTVMISRSFGPAIEEAELEEDITALYRKIIQRLNHINDNHNAFHICQSEELFFPTGATAKGDFNLSTAKKYYPPLNEAQKQAVETSFRHKASFIWGPPGTGKTRTLGIIVAELFERKQRTLVVSHANRAVDVALFNIVKVLRERGVPEDDLRTYVTRYSTTLLSEMEGINLKEFSFEEQLATILQAIRERKQELAALLEKYLRLEESIEQAQRAKVELERHRSESEGLKVRQETLRKRLVLIEDSIDEYLAASLLKKLLLRLSGQHIGNFEKIKAQVQEEEKRIAEHLRQVDQAIAELTRRNHIPAAELAEFQILKSQTDKLGGVEVLKKVLNEEESIDFSSQLKDKRVVATTLAKLAINEIFKKMRFHTVVIDEASMAPMPLLLVASSVASDRVIVTGDPCQLPPISLVDTPEAEVWLGRDIFMQASNVDSLDAFLMWADKSGFVSFLDTQYRMPRHLSLLVSKYFYGGRIIDDKSIAGRRASGKVVDIFDTSTDGPFCGRDQRGQSRYNEVHARFAVDLARRLLSSFSTEKIGIITPYRAQASRIRKQLREENMGAVEVGIIHTFQGREKEVIIFDTTDSPPLPGGIMLDEMGPKGEDALRILTVAFSRARERLVIIANVNYLKRAFAGRKLLQIVDEFISANSEETREWNDTRAL